jgi:hypothetical protein
MERKIEAVKFLNDNPEFSHLHRSMFDMHSSNIALTGFNSIEEAVAYNVMLLYRTKEFGIKCQDCKQNVINLTTHLYNHGVTFEQLKNQPIGLACKSCK